MTIEQTLRINRPLKQGYTGLTWEGTLETANYIGKVEAKSDTRLNSPAELDQTQIFIRTSTTGGGGIRTTVHGKVPTSALGEKVRLTCGYKPVEGGKVFTEELYVNDEPIIVQEIRTNY